MTIEEIVLLKGQGPLYIQLFNSIKKLIISRELTNGFKLPTIRELALKLNVNSVTIVNAYKLLETEGLIEKKIGSGSYVNYTLTNYITDEMDFTGSDSNIDCFPLKDITDSFNEVLNNEGIDIFKYEDPVGFKGLQDSLVKYFEYYNIKTKRELIQIVSGGQQALDIISKALLDFGETVFSETPTYMGAINCFSSREARILYINILNDGLNINELKSKLLIRRPSFLYLMPFSQKPTGVTYSLEKKLQILDLANEFNFYIIEDDLGSELFENNRTLKSLDKYEKVIYIKSFSPLYMPGLRLGCIITPETLDKKLLNIKQTTDISTPSLIQRGFSHYLNKSKWKEYYELLNKKLDEKINETNIILESEFKDLVTFVKNSSPLYWIKLKKGEASELKIICQNNGIKIIPGDDMGIDYSKYILLNIKSIPQINLTRGLIILKKSILELYKNS